MLNPKNILWNAQGQGLAWTMIVEVSLIWYEITYYRCHAATIWGRKQEDKIDHPSSDPLTKKFNQISNQQEQSTSLSNEFK